MSNPFWVRAALVGIAGIATGVACSGSSSDSALFTGATSGGGDDVTTSGHGNASASGAGVGGSKTSTTASGVTSSVGVGGASTSMSSAGVGGASTSMASSGVSVASVSTTGATGPSTAMASSSTGALCLPECSADLHQIVDCNNNPLQTCAGASACDPVSKTCINGCTAAANNKQSIGCEFYATDMDIEAMGTCFAAFIANTWDTPVHINVDYIGAAQTVASFARVPAGQGPGITYGAYDPVGGLPPGQVAILFLSGAQGVAPLCPAPGAVQNVSQQATGVFNSFHITTDVPVVAYQINPYGGGSAAVTGASLLLPTGAWDTNYIAVDAYGYDAAIGTMYSMPSLNIVAANDATTVTLTPNAALTGAGAIPSGPAGTPVQFVLNKGQHAQISQQAELTGSVILSNKPVGLMAGQRCLRVPIGTAYCDHAEQMIPPIKALGHEYVGVMYRPRSGEPAIWRIVGAVDGTTLTYSNAVGGPPTIGKGGIAEFTTGTPFVVTSQDSMHPFMLFTYMSGSQWTMMQSMGGYGDSDFVISVPPDQYLPSYTFFADPTYPETDLVIVRKQVNNVFADVSLDCAGTLGGWTAVGTDYEWTRADLVTGNFANVGGCSTGRHAITSTQPFGLWVWGWGSPLTVTFTQDVSYGYPGGMSVQPINSVVVAP